MSPVSPESLSPNGPPLDIVSGITPTIDPTPQPADVVEVVEAKPEEPAPDNVRQLPRPAPKVESPKLKLIRCVPQFFADGCAFYVEQGQVVLTFASRFVPHSDGTVSPEPMPAVVIRMPEALAKYVAEQTLSNLATMHKQLSKQKKDAEATQAKVQLDTVRRAAEHAKKTSSPGAETLARAAEKMATDASEVTP